MIYIPPNEGLRTAASILPRLPGLVIKLGWTYLRFKRKVKRSAKALKKGLVKNGMPKDMAKQLAESYEIDFSLRKMMKDQGINIPGFSNFFD